MTFYPIIIPISSESDVLYYYPGWLNVLLFGSVGIGLVGVIMLIVGAVGFLAFDVDLNRLSRWGIVLTFGGVFLLLCCLPLMMIFGIRMG